MPLNPMANEFGSIVTRPLQIGQLQLSHRLIQAPLAGIRCAPFRALFSQYQAPAYAVSEMVSAHSILNSQRLKPRYLARSPQEGLWCIQLSGHDETLLYQATQIAERHQPDLIDLNCGCPKPKIRNKGSGSVLTEQPKQLAKVVSAMRKATSLPLTVKIRAAGQTDDRAFITAAKVIEDCGADAIIVHGRHHTEDYDVAADYQQIAQVVDLVNIPVIANGDVCDKVSMLRCFEETKAEAIMIARGSIGKPWLFKRLLQGEETPSFEQRLRLFKRHIEQLALLEGSEKLALFQARRLINKYFPEISTGNLTILYQILKLPELYDRLSHLNSIDVN